jgi:hypothetical protein
VDELAAAGNQGLQFRPVGGASLQETGAGQACELTQHASVDRVGLGEDAQAFGEVAYVARVDQGDRQVRLQQCVDQGAFQAAGGFDDDGRGPHGDQLTDDRADACGVVGDGEDRVDVGASQVKLVLGDVDADEDGGGRMRNGLRIGCVGHDSPSLQMRASLPDGELCRLFGRTDTTPAWTTLRGGRGGPGHDRPWAGGRARVTPRYARRPAGTARERNRCLR